MISSYSLQISLISGYVLVSFLSNQQVIEKIPFIDDPVCMCVHVQKKSKLPDQYLVSIKLLDTAFRRPILTPKGREGRGQEAQRASS